MPRGRWRSVAAVSLLVLLLCARRAGAIEATLFVSSSFPRDNWNFGGGAEVSMTFLKLAVFGVEGARQRSPGFETTMSYLTAHALLAVKARKLTLYGGLGSGVFHQSASGAGRSDFGTLNALILGTKTRVKNLLVLKVEYRRIGLTGDPPLTLDHRVSAGAGLAF